MFENLSSEQEEILEKLISEIPDEELENKKKIFNELLEGKITIAEFTHFNTALLDRFAELAYLKFKRGNTEEAKRIFFILGLLNHKNYYYSLVLGSIYQKEKDVLSAMACYEVAIELNPACISAYVNRGECYSSIGYQHFAIQDYNMAIKLDPQKQNSWTKRAQLLKKQLVDRAAEDEEINEMIQPYLKN